LLAVRCLSGDASAAQLVDGGLRRRGPLLPLLSESTAGQDRRGRVPAASGLLGVVTVDVMAA